MPSGRPSQMAPLESHMITFLRPTAMSSLMMAMPAAPAPLVTTLTSSSFLPTTFRALIRPARVTTAVPCWSSWKMGPLKTPFFFRLSSITKHSGALMSSRFTPPKVGASSSTISTILAVSLVLTHRGKASTSPKVLKSRDLPSMTGMAAAGPMSPRPRTAVPLDTTQTKLEWLV